MQYLTAKAMAKLVETRLHEDIIKKQGPKRLLVEPQSSRRLPCQTQDQQIIPTGMWTTAIISASIIEDI